MKIYPPNHLTPEESRKWNQEKQEKKQEPTDEELSEYVDVYLSEFRKTFETYFPDLAPHHAFYIADPKKVDVVRLGGGILIYYQRGSNKTVRIQKFEEIKPPIADANIFDIDKRFDSVWSEFDFTNRTYTRDDAEKRARLFALDNALQLFWLTIGSDKFEEIARKLIVAELGSESDLLPDVTPTITRFDDLRRVTLNEPAGFRRQEKWAFEFKHYRENRVTVDDIAQTETIMSNDPTLDIVCIVTSGDVTSIGRSIAIENPRLRIWDRSILNHLFHKHSVLLEGYLAGYRLAITAVEKLLERIGVLTARRIQTIT